jgi:hypothetical protein
MNQLVLLFLGCILFVFTACRRDPYDVNLGDVKIELRFYDADSLLSSQNPKTYLEVRKALKSLDNDVYGYLFGYCYRIPVQPDTAFLRGMGLIYNDPYVKALEREIAEKFVNSKAEHQTKLQVACQRMKALLPAVDTPKNVIWVNSAFTSSIFCSKKSMVVGLERYLGATSKSIQKLPPNQFYTWIKEGMEERYLVRDAVLGWLNTHALEATKETYAEEMIRWGKLLFIAQKLLPNESPSVILRYSNTDFSWALASEWAVWKYLVDEQLLYDRSEETKQSLLHEGPFTRGLPQESPDRLGQFLGYRIVEQYVEQHKPSLEKILKVPYLTLLQAYEAPEKQ